MDEDLTKEETVLHMIAAGQTRRQIAQAMSIDVDAVLAPRGAAIATAGPSSRAGIVRYARVRGWLQPA